MTELKRTNIILLERGETEQENANLQEQGDGREIEISMSNYSLLEDLEIISKEKMSLEKKIEDCPEVTEYELVPLDIVKLNKNLFL